MARNTCQTKREELCRCLAHPSPKDGSALWPSLRLRFLRGQRALTSLEEDSCLTSWSDPGRCLPSPGRTLLDDHPSPAAEFLWPVDFGRFTHRCLNQMKVARIAASFSGLLPLRSAPRAVKSTPGRPCRMS